MEKLTEEVCYKAISTVIDPEVGFNVVELGLIYDLKVDDENNVKIVMTLSTPACPLHEQMRQWVQDSVERLEGVKSVELELTFDPPWNPTMANDDVKQKLGFQA